jgi:hypothetical protein
MTGKYIVTTPVPEECGCYHIAEGLKKVMSPDVLNEKDFIPPQYLGKGKFSSLMSNDSYDMYSNELQLTRNIPLSGRTVGPVYTLQFCMGSDMEWQEEESGTQLHLQSGQGTFSFITNVLETCEYQAGEHWTCSITRLVIEQVLAKCFAFCCFLVVVV